MLLVSVLLILSSSHFVLDVKAETTILNPVEDAYVDLADPSSNYGGMSYLKVSYSGNIYVDECLAFLKFDLSGIPGSVIVDSAMLELYASIYVTSTHHISAHYSSDNSWTELGITYYNRPSFNATPASIAAVASPSSWYEWALTAELQTAIGTADRKITIVLKSDFHEGADWVWFESRDQQYSWMEEYVPKLVVSYVPADTTPPSISSVRTNPSQPTPDREVLVGASVSDFSSGVKEVILYYSTDGMITWSNTSMTLTDGSYTGSIPAQSEGTIVRYYIEARDKSLNKVTSSTYSYTAEVRSTPTIDPIIVLGAVIVGVLVIGVIVGLVLFMRSRKKTKTEIPAPPTTGIARQGMVYFPRGRSNLRGKRIRVGSDSTSSRANVSNQT